MNTFLHPLSIFLWLFSNSNRTCFWLYFKIYFKYFLLIWEMFHKKSPFWSVFDVEITKKLIFFNWPCLFLLAFFWKSCSIEISLSALLSIPLTLRKIKIKSFSYFNPAWHLFLIPKPSDHIVFLNHWFNYS